MKTSFFKEPNKWECINNLVGGGTSGKDDGTDMVYPAGVTPPTEEEIETAWTKIQVEYDAQKYARDRKAEYDALNQLELISDDAINGTTTHKDAIVAIKAKYPKG